MRQVRTNTPPIIVERGGEWFVEVAASVDGETVVTLAPLNDGAFFFEQLVSKFVRHRLRAYVSPIDALDV